MNKIAIIDPASYALPYDYFFIRSLSKDYEIDFFCSKTKYNFDYVKKISLIPNVKVHVYNVSYGSKLLGVISYILMLLKVVFTSKKYTAINLQWSLLPYVEVIFLYIIKSKFVMTFHNSVEHGRIKKAYLKNNILASLANKIIFVSDFTKNEFLSIYNKLNNISEKSYVLKHGVMPINFDEANIKNNFFEAPRKIIFWGNVKDYKGVDFLAENIHLIIAKGYSLEIYGKFDRDKKYLINMFQRAGAKVTDEYLSLNEIEKLLSSNIILVLPYKAASQSGVMYTALNYNTVMITTDCGDPYEFLKDCDLRNLSFTYNDSASFEKALDYLSNNFLSIKERILLNKKKYQWEYSSTILKEIFGSKI
ncbi:glycosyltransferase [Escherichia coli]